MDHIEEVFRKLMPKFIEFLRGYQIVDNFCDHHWSNPRADGKNFCLKCEMPVEDVGKLRGQWNDGIETAAIQLLDPQETPEILAEFRAAVAEILGERESCKWLCQTCGTRYAEYVNGCPRCWEVGIRSGVRDNG